MAVSHDIATESHGGTTGSTGEASFSWSHGGAASGVRGVLVFTFNNTSTTAISTGVTYGGLALTAVTGGAAVDSSGEQGRCTTWFLGTSVPQGTQTVVVDRVNNAAVLYAVAITVLAVGNTETNGVVLLQGDQALAEQNVDDGSPGTSSLRYAGSFSGLPTPPAAGANSTALHSIDLGALGDAVVRETTAGQGSRPVGFSATTDDVAAVHLAVREIAGSAVVDVSASGDDGYSYSAQFDTAANGVIAGRIGTPDPIGSFFRFINVNVPQGATVTSATFTGVAMTGAGTPSATRTQVRAVNADNAAAPTSIATFNALARTTAKVDWDPATWTDSVGVTAPDLATVVQEVVNRGGWVSGNALTLLWEDDGGANSTYLQLASLDHATLQGPRLDIAYTVSAGVTGTVAVTQADQTSAASGVETFTATSAQTQADQTSTASGSVANPVTGTVAVTQADQTSAASGVETITGTVAVTQADQTSTATGTVLEAITGTVAVTQADQTSTASGTETITGTSATTQADQTSTATGVFGDAVSGTLATTQADQTSTASGSIVLTIVGTVAVVQDDQTSTATAVETFTGTSANVQADQTSTATGTALVAVTGTVAVTQDNQFSTASGFFGQLTFWSTNPAGYTANPAAFVRVGAGDTPPAW